MTTDNTGADVLGVLDSAIARNMDRGAPKGSPSDKGLRAARAAVAELIAERDALREAFSDARKTAKFEGHAFRPWHKIADRLLRRVGGAK